MLGPDGALSVVVLGGALSLAGMGAWAFWVEPFALVTSQHDVEVPGLPAPFHNFRIAHLTDLHLREWGRVEQRAVAAVRRLKPDIIVLTGDFLDTPAALPHLARFLEQLRPVAPIYAVRGDNDHEPEVRDHTQAVLVRAGVRVLNNEVEWIRRNAAALALAGTDDPHTGQADLAPILAQLNARRQSERAGAIPCVLLAHSPEIGPLAARKGLPLILSGHTHGGQLCLPFWGPLYTNTVTGRALGSGRKRIGKTTVYINRGVGTARVRARFCCRPEVALFRLQAAKRTT